MSLEGTQTFTDMMGRVLQLQYPPRRIISVVPSQTELLYDLGLEEQVTGITRFCIHPQQWFRSKTRVGGTKQLHVDQIRDLQPDLVIANKEENTREQIEALAAFCPVWISDIHTLSDALDMIRGVGALTGTGERAAIIADRINTGFKGLSRAALPKRVAYFIWRDPWMTVGRDTFIHQMIAAMGWINVYDTQARYPVTSLEELAALAPELVLLSSEPYPFKEKHIAELQAILPQSRILLVDGELFSWYGSRLLHTPAYLQQLLDSNP